MKSKTSFFNGTVIGKNVTRFAPVWALYSVLWFLILITVGSNELLSGLRDNTGYWFASGWANSLQVMPLLNCGYAFLCAQLLFGDLYNSRMCNSLHALPLRREHWFASHVLSGLAFSIVPNLVISLVSLLFLKSCWVVAPLWLLGSTLQFIFFFGVAVLSAYCVGNRFAMLLVYGLLNGLSILAYALLEALYMPMLHGIILNDAIFLLLCPLIFLCSTEYIRVEAIPKLGEELFATQGVIVESYDFDTAIHLLDGWSYLLICTAVGVVYLVLGLLAYRKRNLERAGDFLAVGWLRPVFLILYCLCAGMTGHLFFAGFVGEENLFFLVVGLIVGWFTGKMLLERSLRVFGKKSWLGCTALVLVFLLSLGVTKLDLFGIVRWQPALENIKSATVWVNGSEKAVHTDEDILRDILQIHSYGIANPNADDNGEPDMDIYLEYKLKNGTSAMRTYAVDIDSAAGQKLEKLLSRPEYVLGTADTAWVNANLVQVRANDGFYAVNTLGFVHALKTDCELGVTAQQWAFHWDEECYATLRLDYYDKDGQRQTLWIDIYEGCVNTIEWLNQQGYEPMK